MEGGREALVLLSARDEIVKERLSKKSKKEKNRPRMTPPVLGP